MLLLSESPDPKEIFSLVEPRLGLVAPSEPALQATVTELDMNSETN